MERGGGYLWREGLWQQWAMRTPSVARKLSPVWITGIVELSPALITGMYQCVANYRCPKDTTRRLAGLSPKNSFVVYQYGHECYKILHWTRLISASSYNMLLNIVSRNLSRLWSSTTIKSLLVEATLTPQNHGSRVKLEKYYLNYYILVTGHKVLLYKRGFKTKLLKKYNTFFFSLQILEKLNKMVDLSILTLLFLCYVFSSQLGLLYFIWNVIF